MDLKQMRCFLAVAEEGNFGRAAQRLHMAQPPLTRQIHALEEYLGTELFVRTPKGAELTEAGRTLMDQVPAVLEMAQRAEDLTRRAGAGMTGELTIGLFTSGMLNVIPQLLTQFRAARPNVHVTLHVMNKVEQLQALRERRITVGFNRLVPHEPGLAIDLVQRERMLVAVHAEHPLSRKAIVSLRDLDDEPLILYPNSPVYGLAQKVAEAFYRERVRLRRAQEAEDVMTSIALVSARLGVCITTESTAYLSLPGVVYRPLRSRHLRGIELSCIYRRNDPSPVLASFLELVHQWPGRKEKGAAARNRRLPVPQWESEPGAPDPLG